MFTVAGSWVNHLKLRSHYTPGLADVHSEVDLENSLNALVL